MCIYIYTLYIYIHREREREKVLETGPRDLAWIDLGGDDADDDLVLEPGLAFLHRGFLDCS